MKERILYTTAKNNEGNFILAKDAEKGSDFFCPVCDEKIILRKSGNTGKNSKRPHFSHKSLMPNCTPESALHYSYKILLADKIKKHINESKELKVYWHCKFCHDRHSGNLLKKIKRVVVEYTGLVKCKPDITLFDESDKVFAVIEVVVTHKPEANALEFYKANNIILIQVNLETDEDLLEIEKEIFRPSLVDICFNPVCKECGKHKQTKWMQYYQSKCSNCSSANVVIYVSKYSNDDLGGVSEFSKDEVKIANEIGANIKWQPTQNKKYYLDNICRNCSKSISQQIMGRFWMQPFPPASEDELDPNYYYETLEFTTHNKKKIGYFCEHCN